MLRKIQILEHFGVQIRCAAYQENLPNVIQDQESWLPKDEQRVPNGCREKARFSSLVDQVELSICKETARGKRSMRKGDERKCVQIWMSWFWEPGRSAIWDRQQAARNLE